LNWVLWRSLYVYSVTQSRMEQVLENILLSDIGTCPSRAWNRAFEKKYRVD